MAALAPTLDRPAEQGAHYLPPEQLQLLEKLEHLSRYSHYIQVVLGAKDSGKSTLLKQFLADGASDIQTCHIAVSHDMGLLQLLDALVEQLEVEVAVSATAEDKLQAIYRHADLLQELSRQFLIVVDDADRLDDDSLDLLLNLLPSVRNPDARPHLVLFATPILGARLNASPRFKQALSGHCYFIELQPLSAEQIGGFLRHHYGELAAAFSPQQLEHIQQYSFGLPGRIPAAVEQLSSAATPTSKRIAGTPPPASAEQRPALWKLFPRLHLGLAALLATALAGWLLLPATPESEQDRIQLELPLPGGLQPPVAKAPAPEPPALEPPAQAPTLEQRLRAAEAQLQAESQRAKSVAPPPADGPLASTVKTAAVPSKTPQATKPADQLAVAPVTPANPAAAEPAARPKPPVSGESGQNPGGAKTLVLKLPPQAPAASKAVENKTVENSSVGSKAVGSKAVANKTPPVVEASARTAVTAPPVESRAVTTAAAVKRPATAVIEKSASGPKARSITSISTPYLRERELLSWNPAGYTLQMLGARKEKSVVEFIGSRADKNSLYYFSTIYKEKPWYVVVYGNYTSRDKAIAAVASLPADLRRLNPWARSVRGVHDDIRRKK